MDPCFHHRDRVSGRHLVSVWFAYRYKQYHMSYLVGKQTMWFPNRSDTNRPVQAQKRARSLKFRIKVEEEVYYPCSENKGADQLRGYLICVFVFAYADRWFSDVAAHIILSSGKLVHKMNTPYIPLLYRIIGICRGYTRFSHFCPKTDCGYLLEPSRRENSTENNFKISV